VSGLVPVGQYVRDLRADRDRLIENALDWEHLPHLHAGSFASITLVRADPAGWAAEACLEGGETIALDLRLDERGWVTRTRHGGRLASEIRTLAEATGPDTSRVTVDFLVAGASEPRREAVGAFYVRLYERLYDEDERMMMAHARLLRDGRPTGSRTVTLADGSIHAVPLACPHRGLPLEAEPDAEGIVTCPWHGYRYDVRSGRCRPGPSAFQPSRSA
jgi:hypothetical protein